QPAAHELTQRNATVLESAYADGRSADSASLTWLLLVGAVLIGQLVITQWYLARRFRRQINPGLAAATVAATLLVIAAGALLTVQAEHLRVAKMDACDSVLALSRARAVSYDGNADESRFLVDPARAAQYETAFHAKSQQLVQLNSTGVADYDAALAQALDAYHKQQSDLRFGGFFGTEFRNITFTGERAAAEKAIEAYRLYQLDDRRIRAMVHDGKLGAAIAFCTSYHQGDSNWAFSQYDDALSAVIDINRKAFAGAIADGEGQLSGWYLIAWITTLIVIALVLAGVRRR